MDKKFMKQRSRARGAALIEAALIIISFLALSIGGIEYMWYLHVRQGLTSAAHEAARIVAFSHGENGPSGGANSNSLDPYRSTAIQEAQNYLTNLGFSNDFVSNVQISIDFINQLQNENPRLSAGGFSQSDKLRMVGVMLTVPWSEMMIFGDFTAQLFNLTGAVPVDFSVTVLLFRKWKLK